MIKLNDDLLRELGLDSLPLEEKKRMLAHIYETLEMRVGMKLAQQMTDQQLDEFEQFIKSNDEAGALHWLETKFPHYKDVVSAEFENLKAEIRQVAPQILAGAQQAAAMLPQAGAQVSSPMGQPLMSPQPVQPAFGQPPQPFSPAPQTQSQWGQLQQPTQQPWPQASAQQPQFASQSIYGGYGQQHQQPFGTAAVPQANPVQPPSSIPAQGQHPYGGSTAPPVASQPSPQPGAGTGTTPVSPWPDPAQSQQQQQQQQPPLAA